MSSNVKMISTKDAMPVIREVLNKYKKILFRVSGNSMLPWINNNRDQVILKPVEGTRLKPGDIILFQNRYGKYILHRICKTCENGYITIGDACIWEDGEIEANDIIGVVEKIYRKGKEIDCNSKLWRLIFTVWLKLLPVRKYLMQLYYLASRIKGKLKI